MTLDLLYVLGSLWGGVLGPQGCLARLPGQTAPAFGVAGASVSGLPAAVTAFVDVNVIPMDRERVLAQQTVLVAGGRITALGPSAQVTIPAGAVQVDGRGRYLIPGLAAMHRHWGAFDTMDLFNSLAGGVTAASVPAFDYSRSKRPLLWLGRFLKPLDSLQATGIPLPHFYLSPYIPVSTRPDSVAALVTTAKAAGYAYIYMPLHPGAGGGGPGFPRIDRALFDSTLAAARRVGLPVGAHNHALPFDLILALGSAGGAFDHPYGGLGDSLLRRKHPLESIENMRGDNDMVDIPLETIQRVAARLQRAGVWITPTLHCIAHWPSFPIRTKMARQVTKALQEAGVGLLLSEDDGWNVHDELATLVQAGLTPYQALRTGTYNVAQYFGKLNEVGTVAVGKRADLVLLYGNPLHDIRHTREPAGVMVGGRWLDRAELDRRLLAGTTYPTYWVLQSHSSERYRWLVAAVQQRSIKHGPRILGAQTAALANKKFTTQLAALVDSLAAVRAAEKRAYEPLMRRLAAELGTLRATLTPDSYEVFDPVARVWLREQGRRGYQVTIPGVVPTP